MSESRCSAASASTASIRRQGSLGFAAIEVKHRAESESETQRERVGDPLRHGERIGDACERLLGIAEQPFGLSAQ